MPNRWNHLFHSLFIKACIKYMQSLIISGGAVFRVEKVKGWMTDKNAYFTSFKRNKLLWQLNIGKHKQIETKDLSAFIVSSSCYLIFIVNLIWYFTYGWLLHLVLYHFFINGNSLFKQQNHHSEFTSDGLHYRIFAALFCHPIRFT